MSTKFLMKALREESFLKELDVVKILKELTATIFTCEEYTQSRLECVVGSYGLVIRDVLCLLLLQGTVGKNPKVLRITYAQTTT